MLTPNEPQETPDWLMPSRDYLMPRAWAGQDDDSELIVRGEN